MRDKADKPKTLSPLAERLFRPGQRVAAAVSGGADSVALLRALLDRRAALGLVLSIVHVHHGIRGGEADRDQAFVTALATQHSLPIHLHKVDTPAHAAQHSETLEEAARHLRYNYFRELLAAGEVDAVATAHTLDDQAETVLLKLLRGAWTEGLGGISPVIQETQGPQERGKFLRPLLEVTRARIEDYLRALNQPWCEDSTNENTEHTRNRIRHELLPVLRAYNPQIAGQLSRMAAIARDEEAYWQREMARIGPGLLLPGKPVRGGGRASSTHPEQASVAVELERLRALGPALQRRLLRWAAQQVQCSLDFEHTEQLMRLCGLHSGFDHQDEIPPGKRLDLTGEVYAQRTAREVQLIRRPAITDAPPALEITLPIPGEVCIPQLGLTFRAKPNDGEVPREASIAPATIRYVRPGDRVTPRYSSGPKTIKEILERLHRTAAERQRTPVLLWNGVILWLGSSVGNAIELDPASLPPLPFSFEIVPTGPRPQ